MDVEKLIEQLNDWNEKYISNLCGDRTIKCEEYCIKDDCLIVKAVTTLSTLQAENEEMQKHLNEFSEFLCHMTGGLLSKTNYTAQEMISAAEDYQQNVCGERDLRAENEKLRADAVRLNDLLASYQNVLVPELRAELEQVKRENSALWTYIEIIDREYRRYMDMGYIDRLDELRRTWRRGQKEG